MLHGQTTIRLLNVSGGGIFVHAENVVIVAFSHYLCSSIIWLQKYQGAVIGALILTAAGFVLVRLRFLVVSSITLAIDFLELGIDNIIAASATIICTFRLLRFFRLRQLLLPA